MTGSQAPLNLRTLCRYINVYHLLTYLLTQVVHAAFTIATSRRLALWFVRYCCGLLLPKSLTEIAHVHRYLLQFLTLGIACHVHGSRAAGPQSTAGTLHRLICYDSQSFIRDEKALKVRAVAESSLASNKRGYLAVFLRE